MYSYSCSAKREQKKGRTARNPLTSLEHDTLGQSRKGRGKAHKLQSDINDPNNDSTLPGKPTQKGDLSIITLLPHFCTLVLRERVSNAVAAAFHLFIYTT